MARIKLPELPQNTKTPEGPAPLAIRFPAEMLSRVDALIAELAATMPGATWNRSAVIRILVDEALTGRGL